MNNVPWQTITPADLTSDPLTTADACLRMKQELVAMQNRKEFQGGTDATERQHLNDLIAMLGRVIGRTGTTERTTAAQPRN